MSRRIDLSEISILALIGIVTVVFAIDVGNYSSGARFVPTIFLGITAILLALRVLVLVRRALGPQTGDDEVQQADGDPEHDESTPHPERPSFSQLFQEYGSIPRTILVIVSVFLYISIIYFFGFYLAIPIFVFAFCKFIGNLSYKVSFLNALLTCIASYIIFNMVLKLPDLDGIVKIPTILG
ncbi:tripartite tricarboxylate transporter TctB family protein [Cucumibacter marinus]|uniref:tripartite tricarboxylate transporter TctB family protein n=1 Tax=Cucumibacter marinus TaxID=1121252 RepID=UPI00040751B5|nr:tripartite tricarboxylate transporter TctB family protein [Cucumibacter marinus]